MFRMILKDPMLRIIVKTNISGSVCRASLQWRRYCRVIVVNTADSLVCYWFTSGVSRCDPEDEPDLPPMSGRSLLS